MIGRLFIVGIRTGSLKRVWGLYIKAAMQPSAGAGESGDEKRAIKRFNSWILGFCHGFFTFFP